MSDVPRSLQSWVSTIQSFVLTADVFQLFIKHYIKCLVLYAHFHTMPTIRKQSKHFRYLSAWCFIKYNVPCLPTHGTESVHFVIAAQGIYGLSTGSYFSCSLFASRSVCKSGTPPLPELETHQTTEYSYLREEKSLRKMMETTGSIACTARAVRQTGCGAMDLCLLARGSVDAVFGGKIYCPAVSGIFPRYRSLLYYCTLVPPHTHLSLPTRSCYGTLVAPPTTSLPKWPEITFRDFPENTTRPNNRLSGEH